MVLTESAMSELGTTAPEFALPDTVSDKILSLNELKSDVATVIMFICNHCPFVVHLQDAIVATAKEYQQKGIKFIAISANDIKTHPADSPDNMKRLALELDFPFPYLYDETQAVAKSYDARCTPDFFIFNGAMQCVYRGRFDESTPGNDKPITGNDLKSALDSILAGEPVSTDQKPSIGCNIKWKSS